MAINKLTESLLVKEIKQLSFYTTKNQNKTKKNNHASFNIIK